MILRRRDGGGSCCEMEGVEEDEGGRLFYDGVGEEFVLSVDGTICSSVIGCHIGCGCGCGYGCQM